MGWWRLSGSALGALGIAILVGACSSDPAPISDEPATGPTGNGPSTVPSKGDDEPAPQNNNAPPAPPASTSRAKCGAAPYEWIKSNVLGDVLQADAKAPHSILELNYGIIEAKNQGLMKTRRLAKHPTKSRLLRYQTQDRGKLIDATTLLTWPDVSDASKTFPILLLLHGTAGFNDGCAPSKGAADDALGGFTDGISLLLSIFASLGYVVVAPDYIGLKSIGAPTGFLHPYLIGEPTAIASLDAVRAAKKQLSGSAGFNLGDVVVVGGSQGGHAAAFVNRYLPHYAPEITIKGSVWDVPPTDLMGQARPALGTWKNATKNMIAATTTFEDWYRASPTGLSAALMMPYAVDVPAALATSCKPGDALSGATIETMFTEPYRTAGVKEDFDNLAPFACYMKENSLPSTSVPKLDSIPSMFLLGENDDLVDNVVERASFQKLCTQGHVLTFLECAGANHVEPLTFALDQWLDFLEDRLANKPVTDTCTIHPPQRCTSQP